MIQIRFFKLAALVAVAGASFATSFDPTHFAIADAKLTASAPATVTVADLKCGSDLVLLGNNSDNSDNSGSQMLGMASSPLDPVPEPMTLALAAAGLVAAARRRSARA